MLEQWFYRITAYAEKLLGNSFSLGWLEKVKVFQQDLIGKKEGITITYPVVDGKDLQFEEILFVVTRLNTDFGATFVVLAPENPVINRLLEVIEPKQRAKIIKYMSTKSN